MIPFETRFEVIEKVERTVTLNKKYSYGVYLIQIADLKLAALFDIRIDIEVGSCIQADKAILTKVDALTDLSELQLRVDKFSVIPAEDYEPLPYVDAKINGMFVRSKKVKLKRVSVNQHPFIATSLNIRNEEKDAFYVYMVAFKKVAEELDAVKNGAVLNVEARLKARADGSGLEFNVDRFTIIKE